MAITRKRYSFFITDVQAAALKALKARDGINESESIRIALNQYLRDQGVMAKPGDESPARRRVRTVKHR